MFRGFSALHLLLLLGLCGTVAEATCYYQTICGSDSTCTANSCQTFIGPKFKDGECTTVDTTGGGEVDIVVNCLPTEVIISQWQSTAQGTDCAGTPSASQNFNYSCTLGPTTGEYETYECSEECGGAAGENSDDDDDDLLSFDDREGWEIAVILVGYMIGLVVIGVATVIVSATGVGCLACFPFWLAAFAVFAILRTVSIAVFCIVMQICSFIGLMAFCYGGLAVYAAANKAGLMGDDKL